MNKYLIILCTIIFLACDQVPQNNKGIQVFGSRGSVPGTFNKPRALTVSPNGTIFVVDMTGRIQSFTSTGEYISLFSTPAIEKGKPTGLGFSHDGKILVADTHYHRILCYNREGELLLSFGKYGLTPPDFIYVTDIIADKDYYYVTQYGGALGQYDCIQKFDTKGNFIMSWGHGGSKPGEFDRPMSMALDSQENLYVADAYNHRIQKFNKNGELLDCWGKVGTRLGELSYPYGIAINTKDEIYVSEFGNNRIQKFLPDGTPASYFGFSGHHIGMFANPWDIGIYNDTLYVVDALNHRIQYFSQEIFNMEK